MSLYGLDSINIVMLYMDFQIIEQYSSTEQQLWFVSSKLQICYFVGASDNFFLCAENENFKSTISLKL